MTAPETSGWARHRREQVLATAKTTPAKRLLWLEEAIAFAVRAGALPRPDQDHADRTSHPPV